MKKITLCLFLLLFSVFGFSQVPIGNGTNEAQALPFDPYYGYSYSQSIYTSSEINTSGDITGINWYFSGTTLLPNSQNITIFLGHTTKTAFASGTDWEASASLTQVYTGTIAVTGPGWVTINFTTPFTYNGTDNLIVAVDENMASYDSSSDDFYNTSSTTGRSIYYSSDSTNPDPATPPTGTLASFYPNVIFDGITQPCPAPTNPLTANLTATSVDVSWSDPSGVQFDFEYVFQAQGTGMPTGSGNSVGDLMVSNTSLTPNTAYEFWVRAYCSPTEQSSWVGPLNFRTPCFPYTIPYFEGFESGYTQATAIGGCISQQSIAGAGVWNSNSTLTSYNRTPRTGSWNAYLGYSNDDWLFIPIDLVGGTSYTVELYARQDGATAANSNITVSYGTSPSAANMTNPIVGATGIVNGNYQQIIGNFTPATSGVYYVGIKGFMNGTPWYISLDDITIDETPACQDPLNLTASSITTTSADLSWVSSGATLWNIEYGVSGFTPGTGSMLSGVSTNPYTLTGLSPNTTYQYYVQSDCGGSGQSAWAGPFSFTTLCNPYTIPYFEGFESGYAQATAVGGCISQQSITGTEVWSANSTLTDYNRTPRTGSWNAYLRYSNDDWLFIPIDLVGGTSYTVELYARQDGSTATDSNIAVSYGSSPNAAGMTNSIVGATNIINGNYQQIIGNFVPATSGTYFIGIKGYMNGTPWYISLDDISIDETPACQEPLNLTASNFTATSADLSWTSSATLWNIEYGVTGFTQGTGTMVPGVSTNPYTLTGLSANTTYQYYVQSDCDTNGQSGWSGPYEFTTECSTFTAPYTEGFENSGNIPNCWSMSGSEDWLFANSGSFEHIGNNGVINGSTLTNGYFAWVDDSTPNTTDATLLSPFIDVSSLTIPRLTFYELSNNEGSNPNSTLVVEVWDGASWNTVATYNTNTIGGWEKKIIDLSTLTITGDIQIRFIIQESSSFYDDIAIDDVTVEETPSCESPYGFTVANLTNNSADLSWTAISGTYEYVLDTNASDPSGSGTVLNAETYNATGLTSGTSYYFHIRTDCSGSLSPWVTFMFATLPDPPANDDCVNAEVLTPGATYASNLMNGNNTAATDSGAGTPMNCYGYSGGDVWYSVEVPASGNVTIETGDSSNGASGVDTVVIIYSGTCGALTEIDCDDDGAATGSYSFVELTGRTPGETLLVRVYEYSNDNAGEFGISAYDASLNSTAFELTNFMAYPNPVKDILNLEYTSNMTSVSVFNMIGQQVINQKVNATAAKINMTELNSGTYVVQVVIDGTTQVLKVVKE